MLCTIIGISAVITDNRHGCVNRGDRLVTVCHLECHRAEVFICIAELAGCQAHVCGAGVCPGSFIRSVECEVSFRIQRIADLRFVALDCVFCSVIRSAAVMADDGYRRINRRNGLVSVRDVEDNCIKVAVKICEGFFVQSHGCCTGVGSGCFTCWMAEIILRIQRVADLNIISADGMLSAVIRIAPGMTGDGHRHADRLDCLVTVRNYKGHFSEVGVFVHEHICRQAHVCGTRFGPCRSSGSAEGEVIFRILRVVDTDVISADAMFFGIIVCRIVMPGNGHNHVCRLVNRQCAFSLGNMIVICICVFVQRIAEGVCAAAGIRLAACESIGCAFAGCPACLDCQSCFAINQSISVIGLVQVRALQRDIPLRNLQLAKLIGHGIVVRFCVVPGNAVCIVSAAGVSNRSCCCQCDALAFRKAFNIDPFLGQRITVIGLAVIAGCDGHGLLFNCQCAINGLHIGKTRGLVLSRRVSDDIAYHGIRAAAGIRLASADSRFKRKSFRQTAGCHAAVGQRAAVIGLAVACGSQNHRLVIAFLIPCSSVVEECNIKVSAISMINPVCWNILEFNPSRRIIILSVFVSGKLKLIVNINPCIRNIEFW